jgi:hypothetical protein
VDDFGGRLTDLLRSATRAFPGFDVLQTAGVLDVSAPDIPVDRLRVEIPARQFLHLQSVGLRGRDGVDLADRVTRMTASGWHEGWTSNTGLPFDQAALLDFDSPSGTAVHTDRQDDPSWIELILAEPTLLSDVRVRNVGTRLASRVAGIRVLAGAQGSELVSLYDAAAELVQLESFLRDEVDPESEPLLTDLIPTLLHVFSGHYGKSRRAFRMVRTNLSPNELRDFRSVVSTEILQPRSLEWTVHGPRRSFRFWSVEEKRRYIEFTVDVAEDLRGLTDNVAFGFGAVLAVVRDGDLIPHDDDLDLIVGFEPHEAQTLPQALELLESFLIQRGYVVGGDFFAHRHVHKPGFKKLDVFVGLFEGDTVSWFPGTRGALARDTMFPTSTGTILEVDVPLPADPSRYLETIYGPGWKTPDPGFTHSWSKRNFVDQQARSTEPSPADQAPVQARRLARFLRLPGRDRGTPRT